MDKFFKLFTMGFLSLFLIFGLNLCTEAQNYKKKKSKSKVKTEEKSAFDERLWYGGNIGLGFNGGEFSNSFYTSIQPMVGYKFNSFLSAGPRIGFGYEQVRVKFTSSTQKTNTFYYSYGVFARAKFATYFFGHVEGELWNGTSNTKFGGSKNKIKINGENVFVGLGYTSGGEIATEISLLYDLLNDAESTTIPFFIRAGFTYKF